MNENLEKMIRTIRENEKLNDFFNEECDIEFEENDILEQYLQELTADTKSNFELDAFGVAGDGNLYVLLDDEKVGMITTEGQAGIIAGNVREFFSILIGCKYPTDYAKADKLKTKDSFMKYYSEQFEECDDNVKGFMNRFNLTDNPDCLFEFFNRAAFSVPHLEILSLSEDLEDYEPIFS